MTSFFRLRPRHQVMTWINHWA